MTLRARPHLKLLLFLALPFVMLAAPGPVQASVPSLQVTPLQYEDDLGKTVKSDHIDVANPTDTAVTIDASVRGFNQADDAGNLRFYDDPDLVAAIKLDLTSFNLGPREAIRVLFSVDPAKLPQGGVYAAVFFQTRPTEGQSDSSYVAQSANVGTLLLLKNGSAAPAGRVDRLNVPLLQLGRGLHGTVSVANTSPEQGGVAFRPGLQARVFPWGRSAQLPTGLILPSATRQFAFDHSGSFFGLLPLTVTDTQTRTSRTAWVLARTGWYAWLILVLLIVGLCLGLWLVIRRPHRLRRLLHRHRPDRPQPVPQPALPPTPPADEPTLAPIEPQTLSTPVQPAEPVETTVKSAVHIKPARKITPVVEKAPVKVTPTRKITPTIISDDNHNL